MTFTPRSATVWSLGDYDNPELQLGGVDDFGIEWFCQDVKGWRAATLQAPLEEYAGDGGAVGVARRPSKVLTIEGMFRGDPALLDAAEQRFRVAVGKRRGTTLAVTETIPKQVGVQQTGDVLVDPLTPRSRLFSVVMTQADPLKYAAGVSGLVSLSTGLVDPSTSAGLTFPAEFPADFGGVDGSLPGRILLPNPGTEDVLPLITFSNGSTTQTLQNPQARLGSTPSFSGVTRTLSPQERVYLDHKLRTIRNDTVSLQTQKTPGTRFWAVPALTGGTVVFTAAAYNPLATITVQYRPAWS